MTSWSIACRVWVQRPIEQYPTGSPTEAAAKSPFFDLRCFHRRHPIVPTSDTLEEKIADLQARKRGLSDRIMAAADRPLKSTREELLHLLKPLP